MWGGRFIHVSDVAWRPPARAETCCGGQLEAAGKSIAQGNLPLLVHSAEVIDVGHTVAADESGAQLVAH